MTDEEKEAKLELNRYIYGKNLIKDEIVDYLGIIFALIEKQQKEIEELKQEKEYLNCIIESDNDNYINKDKIKARIKELEQYLYKGNIKDDFLIIRIKAKIQELRSLLEKR